MCLCMNSDITQSEKIINVVKKMMMKIITMMLCENPLYVSTIHSLYIHSLYTVVEVWYITC